PVRVRNGPDRKGVAGTAESTRRPERQAGGVARSEERLRDPGRGEELSTVVAAAVLEQRGELADVVDRRIEAEAENRNAAAAVGLDRGQHRRVGEAGRPVFF